MRFKKMKSNIKPAIIKIWGIASVLLISAYLTFLADAVALNTAMGRLLVFAYFVAMCTVLTHLKKRFFKQSSLSFREKVFSAFFAALLLTGFYNILLLPGQEMTVRLEAVAMDDGTSWGEIWLTEVTVDGKSIPASNLSVEENSGWLYYDEHHSYVFFPSGGYEGNHLTLRFRAESVSLRFGYNAWSGNVRITDSLGREKICSLHTNRTDTDTFVYDLPSPQGSRAFQAICMLGCYRFLLLLVGLLFSLTGLFDPHKINQRYVSNCITTGVFLLLFFTSDKIVPDRLTTLLLGFLTAVAHRILHTEKSCCLLKHYGTRSRQLAAVLIALYASMASFGQRYFLNGNTRIHYPPEGWFYLLLGAAWFLPIIYFILFGLELLCQFPERWNQPNSRATIGRRRMFVLLLGGLCVCQTLILWAFWPGGYPSDFTSQFFQAIGAGKLNNWHPVMDTLLFRGILAVIPDIAAIPAIQMFCFALLCTEFLMIGYDHGIPFKILACLGGIFVLLPNQALSGICPVKDYPHMLSLLWGTLLLLRLELNPDKIKKFSFLASLTLDLLFIYGFRHNGVVPFLVLLLFFLVVTIRQFAKVQFRLLAVSAASALLVLLYRGPLFSVLDVTENNSMSPYTTMLCAVGSCVNKDLPLSEEANAILELALPLDEWGDYYSRYEGHDQYYWGRGDSSIAFKPNKITGREAFSIYFEALFKYPDIVLKDRLDGMDILWDIREPEGSFNFRAYDTIVHAEKYFPYINLEQLETTNGYDYYNRSPLAELYRKTIRLPLNNVFDMLLWRTGAYLILLLVLGMFWWGNRMKGLLWASVPLLGNIVGLILVLYHQSFRYVYSVQVLIVTLVFCTICLRNPKRRDIPEREGGTSRNTDLKSVFPTFKGTGIQSSGDAQNAPSVESGIRNTLDE